MKYFFLFTLLALPLIQSLHAGPQKKLGIHSEEISYQDGNTRFKCVVYYQEGLMTKRPGVMVIHEWWGCNDYAKRRATMLAELGYVAIAVDMFGEGQLANNPKDASALASPFYEHPEMGIQRMTLALEKFKTVSQLDTSRIAAIGYCFGGGQVLNAARKGLNLKGVVSFHGSLRGIAATKNSTRAAILVCHGQNDEFVPEEDVLAFKQNLDSLHVAYQFKTYEGTHAFTNPDATENGKKFYLPIAYNAKSDKASWQDMKTFLSQCLK